MFRILISSIAVIAAGPALSLTCADENLAETYNALDASPDDYSIAIGALTAQEKLPPPVKDSHGFDQPRSAKYSFSGQFLTKDGFTLTRTSDVTVIEGCIIGYCAGFPADTDSVLIFLKHSSDTPYTFYTSICAPLSQNEPTKAEIYAIELCMRQDGCEQKQIDVFSLN